MASLGLGSVILGKLSRVYDAPVHTASTPLQLSTCDMQLATFNGVLLSETCKNSHELAAMFELAVFPLEAGNRMARSRMIVEVEADSKELVAVLVERLF